MALHRLTTITIGVPNVAETAAYYTEFGLTPLGDAPFSPLPADHHPPPSPPPPPHTPAPRLMRARRVRKRCPQAWHATPAVGLLARPIKKAARGASPGVSGSRPATGFRAWRRSCAARPTTTTS